MLFVARWLAIISINKKPDTQKILIYARRNICLIRTPVYNGQFLKFTLLIRTPDNADTMDTFLCPEAQTLSTLLFTGTGYLPTVYFPCHNHVLFVNILHCPNNDRFLGLSSRIASMICLILSQSFFPCTIYKPINNYYSSFTSLAFRRSHCSYPSSSLSVIVFISIQHVSGTFFRTAHLILTPCRHVP